MQIAVVCVVNGCWVDGEIFDIFVDLRCLISPGLIEVHGIIDVMVWGVLGIAEVGACFYRFAVGVVLVAHNVPFDMEFLCCHEEAIGACFDHLVLDMVLLFVVFFGQ